MNPWYFPGYTMPLPFNQQPQAYTYGNTPTLGTDAVHESALHVAPSAQSTAGQPGALHLPNPPHELLAFTTQNVAPLSGTESSETPMDHPPKRRKKKAPTLRAKDWEPYKARILELHDEQKLPLPRVKNMIEEEFGFAAELRQYRTRITQWGKDKNVKPQEMSAIVRKRQQRKLVEIDKREQTFTVRGRNVEPHKIDRWMVRNEVSQTSLYAPSPAASTPSAVGCQTISERDSVASSPAYSEANLNFLSRDTTPIFSGPTAPSPISSVWKVTIPRDTAFTGQSPALINRPPTTHSSASYLNDSGTGSDRQLSCRYRQDDEERIREELSIAENSLGISHPETLAHRLLSGHALLSQGRYKSAEEAARRVMEYSQRHHSNGIVLLGSIQLLSKILYEQGSFDEAQKLEESLVESSKAILGQEHMATLASMQSLSLSYSRSGKSKEAEELCVRTLEMIRKALGEKHENTADCMIALGNIYSEQGNLSDAEEVLSEALQIRMGSFGKMHISTIEVMYHLAFIYYSQQRLEDTEELLVQAVDTLTLLLGEEHTMTVSSQLHLALIYLEQGQLKEAESLCDQALMATKRMFGEQHPEPMYAMSLMTNIFKNQGRLEEAEDLGIHLLMARKRVLGDWHPVTLSAMVLLINIHIAQGNLKRAEDLGAPLVVVMKEVLGEEHEDTLVMVDFMQNIYEAQEGTPEAGGSEEQEPELEMD